MVNKKTLIISLIIFTIISLTITFIFIHRVKIGRILTPFMLAGVIAYLLKPIVGRFEHKFSKQTCIICIYFFIFLSTFFATMFIIPEIASNTKEIIDALPNMTIQYQEHSGRFFNFINSRNWSAEFKTALFNEIHNGVNLLEQHAIHLLRNMLTHILHLFTIIFDLILAMIIAYYLIKDSEEFKTSILEFIPKRFRNKLLSIGREINEILESFIRGQLITVIILGFIETAGLYALGVKYPLFLGALGGIANIIPYFGPVLGAIPAIAMSMIQPGYKVIWVTLYFIFVQQIDNAFISPRVIEGKLGLHPLTTIVAVLIGGEFFGILGMLASVPVVAISKVIIKRSIDSII